MLDVPFHLSQPLHVDTNIVYDMDMELFPGLDDPTQMYEPALFIATDWSQFIHDPKDPIIQTEPDLDLFELIESAQPLIPDVDSTSGSELDSDTFQTMLDDVITDNVSPGDILDILDSDWLVNVPDVVSTADTSVELLLPSCVTDSNTDSAELNTDKKCNKKRGRTDDSYTREHKRSKVEESLDIPYLVSVCSLSSRSVMARES